MEASIFLDSGAFSFHSESLKYWKAKKGRDRWKYYHTREFKEKLDEYANFIKKHMKEYNFLYANLDVIGNPELTWRNQKYLEEEHNLSPIPVIHKGDIKWLDFYL